MEGRRVSRQTQKYNPLFILFLCLVAAVIILLIVSIVLGARLGKANKKLKAAEATVTELTQNVTQLQNDLAAARSSVPSGSAGGAQPSSGGTGTTVPAVSGSSWLDLSGHSEVKVSPTNLLDAYVTYYTTAGVNLRSGPGTSYDRITTVDYGSKVEVAAREDGWSFVKVGSRFGWISSEYLSTTQPAAPAATTTARPAATTPSRTTEATSGNLRQ